MHIDLREFRAAYLAEADEHLAAVNACLVEIDAAVRGNRAAPRAVRDLLRVLHTIKGLSSMVGIEPIVVLAHRMESALRGTVATRTVEALFAAMRAIEARLGSVAKNEPVAEPPAALLAELDALDDATEAAAVEAAPAIDPALDAKLGPAEREQIAGGLRSGRRLVRVDFAPSPERAQAGLGITTVRERLERIGDIVKVLPQGSGGGLVFAILVLTSESDESLVTAVGLEPGEVHELAAPGIVPAPPALVDAGDYEMPTHDVQRAVIRVEVARIDDTIEKLSMLVVTRSRLERAIGALAREGMAVRELETIAAENARQLKDLRAALLRLRMIPIATVLDRLPLVVRGLAKTRQKDVALVVDGGAAELDKTVAERIFPAIVHLLRNAVDHGIETPEERRRAGKPERATITIACVARSNRDVEIVLTDDGRGVDASAVAARAGTAVPEDAAALLDLLCRPGLSTRDQADTTSGRGMGMDIVKKTVEGLGGELTLDNVPGRGATFRMRLPLTIAIVDAFSVRSGRDRFVVPVPTVEEIVDLSETPLVKGPGFDLISRRGASMPVLDLRAALGLAASEERVAQALVVRRRRNDCVAFAVDRVVGQQETVIRPLADELVRTPGIAGATDLGDGRATLVLDLVGLAAKLGRAA